MDQFENKTYALVDMARAHVSDADEMIDLAETLRSELADRARKIQELKDLCDERAREGKTDASKAFRSGFFIGFGVPVLVNTAFRIFGI